MKKNYFRIQQRSSSDQLAKDFGEFPPYPLQCKPLEHKVDIIEAGGAGQGVSCLRMAWRIIQIQGSGSKTRLIANIDLGAIWHERLDAYNAEISQAQKGSGWLAVRLERFARVFLLAMQLLTTIRSNKQGIAVFIPTNTASGQINLMEKIAARKLDIEAYISHEHIHFLQHVDGQPSGKWQVNAGTVLAPEKQTNQELLYFLDKKEVEARLHEIVLSHYRATRELPLDPQGFFDLLASSAVFGGELMDVLRDVGHNVPSGSGKYIERDTVWPDVLAYAIWRLESEYIYPFVTEVLSVMYGNLLRYYGDENTSITYLSKIPRPNLYDIAYGHCSANASYEKCY